MLEHLRVQARACADLGSPMYADLLARVAADVERGGPAQDVLAGHEADPGPSALGLRLLGSVHRLVLERRAGALATFYPSVGGSWEAEGGWSAFRDLLHEQPVAVAAWLDHPPQTNEVGRAGALVGGLLRIGESHRLPVRLLEIGASGGLNLRADRFAYVVDGAVVQGPEHSPLRLEQPWRGRPVVPWPDLEVVERLGCDTDPVDVSTTEGRLTLTSYVWPDQLTRLERLRRAFEVADRVPAEVRPVDAVSFVRDLALREGTVTVLWHSVMWQYLPAEDRRTVTAVVEELGAAATPDAPFAHLYAEPARRAPDADHEFLVGLQQWPGGERQVIGTTVGHGLPTTWE
jgi:hypothetical protein